MSKSKATVIGVTKEEAMAEAWRRGILRFMCHKVQKEMYDVYYGAEPNSTLVWLLARQSGKTYLLVLLALEQALRKPNSIVKIITDTKLHARTIVEPKFTEILAQCPQELKPNYVSSASTYHFINGSQIQLAGSDNKNYERLRGQKTDLVLIDEAGFCNDLDDMVESVLIPTTTHTGGKIVLATTPPKDMSHPFIRFREKAELQGNLVKKTVFDNPLLTEQQVTRLATEVGGFQSERFRREYLCEEIKSTDLAVIPEFTDELEKIIVRSWLKPAMYDSYVAMDLGAKDLTVVLFGYYDFRNNKIVIEDEIIANFQKKDMNIRVLTSLIMEKESSLWTNSYTGEVKDPAFRVSDINPIVTQEIYSCSDNKLYFSAARKDDNDAAINNMRTLIGSGKVIIEPRCETLIRHLRNVKWASESNKKTFARSADEGHYDAVDALKYLLRHINVDKNPYPAGYNMDLRNTYVTNPSKFNQNDTRDAYKKIFGIKKR